MKRRTSLFALLVMLTPWAQADALSRTELRHLQLIERDANAIYALVQTSIEPIEVTVDIRAGSITTAQKGSLAETRTMVDLLAIEQLVNRSSNAKLAWSAARAETAADLRTVLEATPYAGKDRCGRKRQVADITSLLTVQACTTPNATLQCVAAKDQFALALSTAQACLFGR